MVVGALKLLAVTVLVNSSGRMAVATGQGFSRISSGGLFSMSSIKVLTVIMVVSPGKGWLAIVATVVEDNVLAA